MSFWRTFGFHTVSAIDTILDKDEFTLEELLDEEEILQEVKSQNKRLLDFLTQPQVLKTLLEYITVEPPADADSKRKFKHPFLACEILCSDVWTLCDAVYKDEALVHQLYSFLAQPAPLNHQLANYVCRSAGVLLQRKITETVDYMKSHGMIEHFIQHLNNASVMDLLLKVISCEETSEGSGILDWLCETDLIPCLVHKFDKSNTAEVHENAAQALVDIISVSGGVASSPLIRQLESEPIVSELFDHVLSEQPPGSALLHGLTVAIELLARVAAEASANGDEASAHQHELPPPLAAPAVPPVEGESADDKAADGADKPAEGADKPAEGADADKPAEGADAEKPAEGADAEKAADTDKPAADADKPTDAASTADGAAAAPAAADAAATPTESANKDELSPLLAQTLKRLEAFSQLLKASGGAVRAMSTGESLEPFGFGKLKILEFFAMVVRLNSAPIDAELQRLDVFATAMDAFFKYTWNNFLHATVEQIVGGVLEGNNVPLQCSLVTQTKLLQRVVDADAANTAEEQKKRGVRRGYMGHLSAIALRLQSAAARAPQLEELLAAHEPWNEYVNGSLARLRAAEAKPLGGHRPMGGPGESSDEDEEELDDDGDSIFDRYQLGFGNEDFGDDDDEDDDDDDERDIHFDDDGEFGRDDAQGAFEMYEDGSDDSGDDGDWPAGGAAPPAAAAAGADATAATTDATPAAGDGGDPAADVEALVANVEATPIAGDDAPPAATDAAAADDDAEAAEAGDADADAPAPAAAPAPDAAPTDAPAAAAAAEDGEAK